MMERKKNKILREGHVVSSLILCMLIITGINCCTNSNLVATLGISAYASKKIIDIISTAGTIWSVVGIVATIAGSGGIGVGVLATAKFLVKKYGKKYAARW